MYIKLYNKLVRDNIPTIIEASGKECEYEQLSDERAMEYLYVKLYEEADELVRDKNIEELADILEVVFAIANKYGYKITIHAGEAASGKNVIDAINIAKIVPNEICSFIYKSDATTLIPH